MIIENHISINEIIPKNILYFNNKYYLQNIKAINYLSKSFLDKSIDIVIITMLNSN